MLTQFGPRISPFDFSKPWKTLRSESQTADIGVLGIPFDGGTGGRLGTAEAPARLRELARHKIPVTEEGERIVLTLRDYGDVVIETGWEHFSQSVQTNALEVLQHPFALFLGGDHSITIPLTASFDAATNEPWGLIQFDAHPDLADSERGFRWSHACTARRALELPNLSVQNLAFVGLRSFMDEEVEWLNHHPETKWFSARACYKHGVEHIAQEIISQMANVSSVYFSLDIDGLDPAYAPGTGTPQPGGLSTRELLELIKLLLMNLPIKAMDIVEVSPPLDCSDITSFAAMKVIHETFGALQRKWKDH